MQMIYCRDIADYAGHAGATDSLPDDPAVTQDTPMRFRVRKFAHVIKVGLAAAAQSIITCILMLSCGHPAAHRRSVEACSWTTSVKARQSASQVRPSQTA
jgi:hypothetical protein